MKTTKTQEDRARAYTLRQYPSDGYVDSEVMRAHIAGAKAERAELVRWRNPEETPPERGEDVLIKLQYEAEPAPSYTIGYWNGQWFGDFLGAYTAIIGWREINE